jgi:hypothetical protein
LVVVGHTAGAFPGHVSAGNYDVFVVKFDDAGNELWSRQFGTSGADFSPSVATNAAGNVLVAGSTNLTLPGQPNVGGSDAFARAYDAAGNELWTRQFGTSGYEVASAAALDTAGNAFVAGNTVGAFPGQESFGLTDVFVRKYDASGQEVWTQQLGTSSHDATYGLATDASDHVFVAGTTSGPFPGQLSFGESDGFVVKLNE